jgi:hypothetical protein
MRRLYSIRHLHKTTILALMKFKLYYIVWVICGWAAFSCLTTPVAAQAESQLRSLFTNYSEAGVAEEIFVHCDKDLYLAGEICWFKVYCVDAFLHRPISISKLAYWELVDRLNNPVAQLKIGLQDGFGNGSYPLPGSLNSGTYKVRCYTNWMKNFDAGFFFEKEITVINPHQYYGEDTAKSGRAAGDTVGVAAATSQSAAAIRSAGAIRFYPEGGNLVNGIPSTVAFKISGSDGQGVEGSGCVFDDRNDTLCMIRTQKMGIGKFVFTPQGGRSYKAVIWLAHGEKMIAGVPGAYDQGYVMHLLDSDENRLKITVEAKGVALSSRMVYLFVHTRGSVKIVQGAALSGGEALFVVDKKRLGEGMSQITIFDAEKHPVCERLYFKYPDRRLEVRVSADKDSYGRREKIEVTVDTREDSSGTTGDSGGSGRGRAANLSMAVYKIDTLQPVDRMNIENYLWLSGDLANGVEEPEYYFEPGNPDRESSMDNLLLTQGWRRFRWEDVLQGKKPAFKFLPEYTGHIIMARIFDSATKMPVPNREVFVSSPSTRTIFNAAASDSNGVLRFEMRDFYTNGELVLRPEKPEDSIWSMEVQSPFSAARSHKPFSFFSFGRMDSVALTEYHRDVVVQREYGGLRPGAFFLPDIDTTAFFGKPDKSYLLDDYVRFTTMEEVLREYVAETSVRNRGGHFEVSVFDKRRTQTLLEPAPLVLLDGVPTDINRVIGYDPLKVKRLDIITEGYFYGNLAFGGILSFVTYHGDLTGFDLDQHSVVVDYAGLEAEREFDSPTYDTKEELDSRLPDFRRLLYWQPNIITDGRGNNTQRFFSSDEPGRYVVVVQGVSDDGEVGWGVREFEVKRE